MIEDRLIKRGYAVKYEVEDDEIVLYHDNGTVKHLPLAQIDDVKKDIQEDAYQFSLDYIRNIKNARRQLITSIICGSWTVLASTLFILSKNYASFGTLSYIIYLCLESLGEYRKELKQAGLDPKIGLIRLSKSLDEQRKYKLYLDNQEEIEEYMKEHQENNLIQSDFDGTFNSLCDIKYKTLKKFVKANIERK